ncbi:PTS system mannose/fructose/sorbose family transporter subunit IID [bacterium]|nr:PTS system mannose/fructose/sorbose family transporter subunit IID [bacterium]
MTLPDTILFSALAALISMDQMACFQMLLSRPILTALVLGSLFGNLGDALFVGVTFEFLFVRSISLKERAAADPALATAATLGGMWGTPPISGMPDGFVLAPFAAGLALLASFLSKWFDVRLRTVNVSISHRLHRPGFIQLSAASALLAKSFGFYLLAILAVQGALPHIWHLLGDAVYPAGVLCWGTLLSICMAFSGTTLLQNRVSAFLWLGALMLGLILVILPHRVGAGLEVTVLGVYAAFLTLVSVEIAVRWGRRGNLEDKASVISPARPEGVSPWDIFFKSFFVQAAWNDERMQNIGFLFAVRKSLSRIWREEPRQFDEACARSSTFFNTHPYFSPALMGMVVHIEEKIAEGLALPEDVESAKGRIGPPLNALGSLWFWDHLKVLCFLMALPLLMLPHPRAVAFGAIAMFVCFNISHLRTRWLGLDLGLRFGEGMVKDLIERFPSRRLAAYRRASAFLLGLATPLVMSSLYLHAQSRFPPLSDALFLPDLFLFRILAGLSIVCAAMIILYYRWLSVYQCIAVAGAVLVGAVRWA